MAELYVLSGPDVGRSFEVRSGDTLGRSPDCILVLKHASISRRHAHLEESDGAWTVIDDGSRNGIVSDGVRSKRLALADGQEFQLGEVLLRFRCGSPAQEPASEPPLAVRDEPAAAEPPRPPAPPSRPRPQRRPTSPPDEAEELVLEGAEEIDLAAAARAARAPAQPPPTREGLAEQRGRVLQYHRVPESGSALSFELAQLPAWKRYAVYLLALALLAAVTAAAFLGAAFVKERVGGGGAPAALEGAPDGG